MMRTAVDKDVLPQQCHDLKVHDLHMLVAIQLQPKRTANFLSLKIAECSFQPLGWQSQHRRQSRCGQNNNNNHRPFNRYGLGQMTCSGGVAPAHLRDEPKLVGRSDGQEACYEQHLDD